MKFNTRNIFTYLIRNNRFKLYCDIGTRDCKETVHFSQWMPDAKFVCFEANPNNFQLIQDDTLVDKNKFDIRFLAVTNANEELEFFIYNDPDELDKKNMRDGTGSLMKRENREVHESYKVQGTRLDDFLKKEYADELKDICLWVDVEGAAYQVIEGIEGVADGIMMIYTEIEVESVNVYENQVNADQLGKHLESLGFVEAVREVHYFDDGKPTGTGDAIYINKRSYPQLLKQAEEHMEMLTAAEKKIKLYNWINSNFPFLIKLRNSLRGK